MTSGADEAVKMMWAVEREAEMRENKLATELAITIARRAERLTQNEYFMNVAKSVSARATCPRRAVGAILVYRGRIVSSGYNGSPRGLPHCTDSGCELVGGHCVRAVHAEANCLLQAAEHGAPTNKTTLYTTASPCRNCMSLIINAGVKRVVYAERYGDNNEIDPKDAGIWSLEAAEVVGIEMIHRPYGGVAESAEEAARAAALAIYFSDNSDYLSALWDVVKVLDPKAIPFLESSKLPPWMRAGMED